MASTEVAYNEVDLYPLLNCDSGVKSGIIGFKIINFEPMILQLKRIN